MDIAQKGFAHILILLLLLAGLAAGVYLVSNTQIFKSRAGNSQIKFKDLSGDYLPEKNGIPYTSQNKVLVELHPALDTIPVTPPPAIRPQPQIPTRVTVTIMAWAVPTTGNPVIFLQDGTKVLGRYEVKATSRETADTFTFTFPPGISFTQKPSVRFPVSDVRLDLPHRQVFIDSLTVDGVKYETEDSNTYYQTLVTTNVPGVFCKSDFLRTEFMNCPGIFVYNKYNVISPTPQISPIASKPGALLSPTPTPLVLKYNVSDFSKANGSSKGDARYNVIYDFNQDGKVNFGDFPGFIKVANQPIGINPDQITPSPAKGSQFITPTPVSHFTKFFKIAENPTNLKDAPEREFKNEPFEFQFKDNKLGQKFVFVQFIRSDGAPTPVISAEVDLVAPNSDLDVTYIERTPRYLKYCVTEGQASGVGVPKPCPGTENTKHWPDEGEMVTYTAHLINKGPDSWTGGLPYVWTVDGKNVLSQTNSQVIKVGQELTFTYQMAWKNTPTKIEFKLEPGINDLYQVNNSLQINSHDLTLSYFVEKAYYDLFNKTKNMVGTYSFEDWVQSHIKNMNLRFSQAKYPVAPNGIKDTVRIDKIVVADQLDISGCPPNLMSQDPDEKLIDGRWLVTDGDCANANITKKAQDYINSYATKYDWGLNHESTHQLGVIDLYRFGIPHDHPNFGIKVLDINSNPVQREYLPQAIPPGYPGLMGGGDTAPYNDGTYYESLTAGCLNSNYLKRRAYYGDCLFDTPDKNIINLIDQDGKVLKQADVAVYQKTPGEDILNTPVAEGKTDDQGGFTLPNRPVVSTKTESGHQLKDNPFGQIAVTGQNGTFLIKVTKDNSQGFGMLYLSDLNIAYWSGNQDRASYLIKTTYPKLKYDIKLVPPTPTPTPRPDLKPGLIEFYKMDEESGVDIVSSTGSNPGQSTSASNISDGKIGQARSFSGSEYITTPISSQLNNLSGLSLSAWIKTDYLGNNQFVVAKDNAEVVFTRINIISQQADFWAANGGCGSNISVADGKWHLIVGTFDGSKQLIYIDNVLKNTCPAKANKIPAGSADFYIGTRTGLGDKFHGSIDAVGIWNRALNPEEINLLWNNGSGIEL